MVRKVIDVGLANNDGTGDSIRDSFKKVNDNFQELYASLGLGERLRFINLDDAPGSYLNQQGKLLVVNQTQDGIEFRRIQGTSQLAIDIDDVAGTITLRPLNQDIINDTTPQLGGELDARQNRIRNLPTPVSDSDVSTKKYTDSKIALAGVDAINPETGLTDASYGTMTGALVLSRNPITSDDEDYDGLVAATKKYVDLSSFTSTTSLYVNLGGQDSRNDIPENRIGRSQAYAFRTVEKALKECEKIIADSPFELSVYAKRLVYSDGIPCTLTKIEPALNAGSGAVIIPRLAVDIFKLRNAGTGYKAGDILQMGLASNPGTFSSRASVRILRVSNVNGAILSYEIIGRGNYTGLPGVSDVGTTLSVAQFGSVGAGSTFDLTYKVSELSVTTAGSNYGPVSIIITGGGGSGAAASAIVSSGQIVGTTLLQTGSGYTSLPTVEVYLPRLFVFTNGIRTDFSSSNDPLARDIREGLGIKGSTSGAVAEILSHNAVLDDAAGGYPSGTGKNEIFDVGILSGQFIAGEELFYGELIKTKQITVQIESGVFEENYPLRVSNNVSIIGEEFRRTLIRPKAGVSTSPYTQIYFRRDPIIDKMRVTNLFGINYAPNTTATPSAVSGDITVTLGSGTTNTNWIGKIWKSSSLRGEGRIISIVNSTQFKVRIHDTLTGATQISAGAVFTATISGTTLTVSSPPTSGSILPGMEINAIGATSVYIGTTILRQLTGTVGGQGTYELSRGSKIANSTSMFASNWQIYSVNAYGYHYLSDPSRPIWPVLENTGRLVNAATLLSRNRLFLQEEVVKEVLKTFTSFNTDTCKRDVGLIVDAIVYDMIYGGYSRTVEAALKYYQTASGRIAIGISGTPETGFIDLPAQGNQKAPTLGAISYLYTLALKVIKNETITRTNTNPEAFQEINFSLTREPASEGTLNGLINVILGMLGNPEQVNFPKDNRELDVFMMNDANILRQITIQGHGGFAQVLDPEGQILNKSPYSQQGSVFSASNNKQRFAGGMFVDGYSGNQMMRIRSKTTTGGEANYVFEVDKLFRRPQLPCPFTVEGVTYVVNYLRNFVYSSGANGSTATLVLDSSTPYTNSISGIITPCTVTGDGTYARLTFPLAKASPPFTVGNMIDVSGFVTTSAGYNGIWTVTACTTTYVEWLSGETESGSGGTVAESFELITAGYRSLLSNDWTQLNDMGYGLFVTNGGISEAVGMFTYYCYNAYYASNGGQIRSVGGSAAHGIYALRAEGSDPKEVPDAITVQKDFIMSAKVYAQGQYTNAKADNEIYITDFNYEPLVDSELEILHYRNLTAADGLPITQITQNGTKTVLSVANADQYFQTREYIQINGIASSNSQAAVFNYNQVVSGNNSGIFRVDSVTSTTLTIDTPTVGTLATPGITITGSVSFSSGIVTVTFASQTQNPYVTGQKIKVSGINVSGGAGTVTVAANSLSGSASTGIATATYTDRDPPFSVGQTVAITGSSISDYNGNKIILSCTRTTATFATTTTGTSSNAVTITPSYNTELGVVTAVTQTTVSYSLGAVTPGTYANGGALSAMIRATGVRRVYAINSVNYGDGSSFGGIPDKTARMFFEPIVTQPGETGLYASVQDGQPVIIRQSRQLWLNGVSSTSAAKNSTALIFNADDPENDVIDVITYAVDGVVSRVSPREEAIAACREGYRYIELTAANVQRKVGNDYYGSVGSTNLTVTTITDTFDINKLNSGRYSFHWYGVEYIVLSYTPPNSPTAAFITLNKQLQHPLTGYNSQITVLVGPKNGEPGSISIKISTLRATAFDLLDIGSGSYADTNYPNNIFGPPVNKNQPSNEAAEVGNGRVFYTTIDQEGNFKVGKLFGVNQSTGEATLSARISLTNIASLQLSQGVPINEFTADPNFSSPSALAVATELATKLYIDRRLGHDGVQRIDTDRIGPGFIDTAGNNYMAGNFNMGDAGRIINMKNPSADSDAATRRWISIPHLRGNTGSVSIPNCTVIGNGTTATVTFSANQGSAPFTAGQVIGITGFSTAGFNNDEAVVVTCSGTGLTYSNATNGSGTGGTISSVGKGNLLVYTGASTSDINETNVASESFVNAAVTGDIDVTLNQSLRTINFQLVNETIINTDISQSAAIEQKKLILSEAKATTGSTLGPCTATATGGIVTVTYPAQSDSVTGASAVPVTAGDLVIVTGFANATLNGVFAVRASPTPSNISFTYNITDTGLVITSGQTTGVITLQRGVSTFDRGIFTVTNGHATVKNNGIQFGKLVKINQNRVLGYTGTDPNGDVGEVQLTDIVSKGGGITKALYTGAGVLYAKAGATNGTDDNNFIILPTQSTTYTTSNTANSAENLVARNNNGDAGLRNLTLDGDLFLSRSTIGSGADYKIITITGDTTTKSTTIYGAGVDNKARISIQNGQDGTNNDRITYFGTNHIFVGSGGSGNTGYVVTQALTAGVDLADNNQGKVYGNWTLNGNSKFEATYADLAEYYEADREYEVGTVLVFGGDKEVTTSNVKSDHRVAGVVSNTAAYTMNQACPGIKTCVALQGRVPVKVVGKINKGDLIVTSGIPGVAMAATGDVKVGTLIGKAIGSYDSDRIGTVEVSVGRT